MKIVFKGIERQSGLTSSACALAVLSSIRGDGKTIVMQHKSAGNDLKKMLTDTARTKRVDEASSYYVLEGMDYLIWNHENGSLNRNVIDEVLVPVADKRLYYLPSGERLTPDLYPEKTAESESLVLRELTKMSDNVFIDCGVSCDDFTKALTQEADLVINVLPQNESALNSFFAGPQKHDKRNLYLFSNYDSKSVLNLKNLSRIYRIPTDRICAIPENAGFLIALSKGSIKGFLEKNLTRALNVRNEVFMTDLNNAYETMNRAVNLNADIRNGDFGLCGAYKDSYKRNLKRKFV